LEMDSKMRQEEEQMVSWSLISGFIRKEDQGHSSAVAQQASKRTQQASKGDHVAVPGCRARLPTGVPEFWSDLLSSLTTSWSVGPLLDGYVQQ
jgi:hypothetical protein